MPGEVRVNLAIDTMALDSRLEVCCQPLILPCQIRDWPASNHPGLVVSEESENPISDSLCTRCGLCCDGTLFGNVPVSAHEQQRLVRVLNVAATETGAAFVQPCSAFKGGFCGIYPERPSACSKYRCKLLRDVAAGRRSASAAGEIIQEVKAMRASIDRAVGREVPALAGLALAEQMATFERHFDDKMPAVQFRKKFARLLLDYFVLNKRLNDQLHVLKKAKCGS